MIDPLSTVYPDIRIRTRRVYANMLSYHKLTMRATQGLRSHEEQAKDYAQGRTTPGPIISYAKSLQSLHEYGCATDSCFTGPDPYLDKSSLGVKKLYWSEFGKYCKLYGLKWGGDFLHPDEPHSELTYGLTLSQILEINAIGGITGVWTKFDKIRGVEVGSEWRV